MSINKVFLSGNLTRDPEIGQTANGVMAASFGIAVNDRRRNASGEWEDYPNFVECNIYGNRAKVAEYLYKGAKVAIEGKLRYSSWEKNGEKRNRLQVIVDEIELPPRGQAPVENAVDSVGNDYADIPF